MDTERKPAKDERYKDVSGNSHSLVKEEKETQESQKHKI